MDQDSCWFVKAVQGQPRSGIGTPRIMANTLVIVAGPADVPNTASLHPHTGTAMTVVLPMSTRL